MENLYHTLEECLSDRLLTAVISGARKKEGPTKVKIRPLLKKGDLIFFPGHVAVHLGNGRYVHSTGYKLTPCVTLNSLNPQDPDYRGDLAEKVTAYGSIF